MQLVPKTMDFRLKLFSQKVASFLPYGFYRFMVEHHPKLLHANYDKLVKKCINNCSYVRSYGLDLKNKVIVETGTGASLADPITFYLAGAAKTYTFDIKLHVNARHVWGIIDHYETNLRYSSEVMEISISDVKQRWKTLKQIREMQNLHTLLHTTNIHLYESRVIPKDVAENSVDIFFSNSVLQRISLRWLKRLLKDASRVLKEDGFFWHKVDCNDINSMYDRKISKYHYLKYSDWYWKLTTSEIFNNQNRLRQSDFLKLLKEVGFNPIFIRSRRPKDYREQLNKIKLNKHFQEYNLDDLSITNFIIYAGRETLIKEKSMNNMNIDFEK